MQSLARTAVCASAGGLSSTRRPPRAAQAALRVQCSSQDREDADVVLSSRREVVLYSLNAAVLGSLFTWGAVPRPSGLGVQDYGGGLKTLALCPPSPNCVSTAEVANDMKHYVPGWSYNPENSRGKRREVSQAQAVAELLEVVTSTQPDGFTPRVIEQTDDYLAVEYQSPTFGFIDDFEVYFPADQPGHVEYRSASRIGESDGDINRKRIRTIRKELEKKGWRSLGF